MSDYLEQANLDELRAAAAGARSVADGREEVLADALNIERAAAELEALRQQSEEFIRADERAKVGEALRPHIESAIADALATHGPHPAQADLVAYANDVLVSLFDSKEEQER